MEYGQRSSLNRLYIKLLGDDEIINSDLRLGQTKENNSGSPMKIIRYVNAANVIVEFQDDHKFTKMTTYQNFERGTIINPWHPTVYNNGFLGEGKYMAKVNNASTKKYSIWSSILSRCYNEKERHKYSAYIDCIVCDEWLNFQTFAKWFDDNYYDVDDGKRMHIDKDILIKGNKVYSPDTCIFVPQRFNMLFIKQNREVDTDLPNGIRRCVGGYRAEYNTKSLGVFKNLEDAINRYLTEKRIHIKQLVEEYGVKLPTNVQNALLNW